ncbi:hypothetical protein FACS1894186_1600 [Alphaproteobacteria bacterium]|nr:hypothetical protein FACS1894186_1600 [Alphaproteobacteria bacterium]
MQAMTWFYILALLAAVAAFLVRYNLFRPPKNPLWPRVLMHHSVAPPGQYGGEHGLNIPPEVLERHIKWLKKHGYTFLTLAELPDFTPDRKHVVLTFDDGIANNAQYVSPLLQKYGIRATIFPTWDNTEAPVLSDAQIREMADSGLWEVGAHTLTHRNLRDLPDEEATREIVESKAKIESITGKPCVSFSYPYGQLDDRHVEMVRAAGFRAACTTKKRILPLTNPLKINRLSIITGIDPLQFYIVMTRGKYRI